MRIMSEAEAQSVAIIVTNLMFEVADDSEDADRFLEIMIQRLHE